ncbi:GTPase [Rhodococcus koreensis]
MSDPEGAAVADPGSAALIADVQRLLHEAGAVLDSAAQDRLARLSAVLTEPLTMAVAGRTNAGKSTLVNALIGARVAPTRATECTRVVTWFRFGPDQPRVVCRDGTIVPLGFTAQGQLPDELGVAVDRVERVEVWLSFEPLRAVTVIDTPGLSGDQGLADQTEQLLAGGAADVLLFVLGGTIRADEWQVVADFRARSSWLYDFPGNALGVLSRADQLGRADQLDDGDSTWAAAQTLAAGHAETLASGVAGVLPVMGKIAETTESGAFDEEQAGWLRTLAAAPPEHRADALLYAGAFRRAPWLSPRAQSVLLERLDLHGIRVLSGSASEDTSAVEMYETLRTLSGIAALRERIDTMFVRPAAIHKTVRVLAELEQIVRAATTTAAADRDRILGRIQTIRDSDPMHRLAELRALADLYSGRCVLPDANTHDLALRLFSHPDPASRLGVHTADITELTSIAKETNRVWKTLAVATTDPRVTQVADTAAWSAYLIYRSTLGRAQ